MILIFKIIFLEILILYPCIIKEFKSIRFTYYLYVYFLIFTEIFSVLLFIYNLGPFINSFLDFLKIAYIMYKYTSLANEWCYPHSLHLQVHPLTIYHSITSPFFGLSLHLFLLTYEYIPFTQLNTSIFSFLKTYLSLLNLFSFIFSTIETSPILSFI